MPVFAFLAAGVTVVGGGLGAAFADPAALGVVLALVVGKAVGVMGGTWGFARFTRAELDDDLAWTDVLGLSLLAGIGFTVSLLIGGLAYGPGAAARRTRQGGHPRRVGHRGGAGRRRPAAAQPASTARSRSRRRATTTATGSRTVFEHEPVEAGSGPPAGRAGQESHE